MITKICGGKDGCGETFELNSENFYIQNGHYQTMCKRCHGLATRKRIYEQRASTKDARRREAQANRIRRKYANKEV